MAETHISGGSTRTDSPANRDTPVPTGRDDMIVGGGWLAFASVMFTIAALFNVIYGISALVNDDYFAADELLFGDLSLWGVLYFCAAALQLLAAGLIMNRSGAGAVLGIFIAALSATLALVSIGAYPIWSIILLVIDGLIIYGLTVYGFASD